MIVRGGCYCAFVGGGGGSLPASEFKRSSQIQNLVFINRDPITVA